MAIERGLCGQEGGLFWPDLKVTMWSALVSVLIFRITLTIIVEYIEGVAGGDGHQAVTGHLGVPNWIVLTQFELSRHILS